MKKRLLPFIGMLILLLHFSLPVAADIGPKPSVVVDFEGLEGNHYYVTLLSETSSTGPYSALGSSSVLYPNGDPDYPIFAKFTQYEDDDGYYFLQYFENCTETQRFSWSYYPPQRFKILLYFPDVDRFAVSSEIYERYAFDSYFTVTVADVHTPASAGSTSSSTTPGMTDTTVSPPAVPPGTITALPSYDYRSEILTLAVRTLLTIAIELGIALLFGLREKRLFSFIAVVNVVTQILLNIALNLAGYTSGPWAFMGTYILLESLIFVLEALLYIWFANRQSSGTFISKTRLILYALFANGISFGAGLGLSHLLPKLF